MQRDAQFPANARAGALDFFDEKSKRTWPNDHPAAVSVDGAGATLQVSPTPNPNHDPLRRESS